MFMRATATRRHCSVLATIVAFAVIVHGAEAAASTATASPSTVVVRSGETLSGIAARFGVSISALAAANGIANPNFVFAGQVLQIPGAQAQGAGPYTVRRGDTLAAIGRANGVAVADLVRANGIKDPNHIVIGATLVIPGAASGSAAKIGELPEKLVANPDRLALRESFEQWAATYGVPADLLEALAWMESGWQNRVVSSTGARGIGQLMPATVDVACGLIGVRLDPGVPDDNIRMSARFLRYLLDSTGDPATALAAYYQGLASVQRSGPYPGTVQYVNAILALRSRFA